MARPSARRTSVQARSSSEAGLPLTAAASSTASASAIGFSVAVSTASLPSATNMARTSTLTRAFSPRAAEFDEEALHGPRHPPPPLPAPMIDTRWPRPEPASVATSWCNAVRRSGYLLRRVNTKQSLGGYGDKQIIVQWQQRKADTGMARPAYTLKP